MKLLSKIYEVVSNWLIGPHGIEQYSVIETKVILVDESKIVVSEALRGDEVPFLGSDHEKLLVRAMINYPTDKLRIQWLQSVHKLNQSKAGWVIKGGEAKWGIPGGKLVM